MPDIFKTPWLYMTEEDTVLIPDFTPDEPVLPEEDIAEEADASEEDSAEVPSGDAEHIDGEIRDRRIGIRRQTDRRAEDAEGLESLKRRYREKLRQAKEEFLDDISPRLLEDLREQMMEIREEAYRDELIRQQENIRKVIGDVDRGMKALKESHEAYIHEFTEELKFMALDIAERILHKEIDSHEHALETMALELVAEVKDAPWINVEVSEEVGGLADYLKTQLSKAEQGKTIYVNAKDKPPDSLRIVTEEGVVDATISTQLKQLREAFISTEREGENVT